MVVDTKLYEVLDLQPGCSEDEVKRAYRRLVARYHPDRARSKSAEEQEAAREKTKEINAAYEVLSDPEKRSNYDKYGPDGINQEGMMGNDIFNFFFGGGHRRPRGPKKSDFAIVIKLSFTLKDAFAGCSKTVLYKRKLPCEPCKSTGAASGKLSQCATCGGAGEVVEQQRFGLGVRQLITTCPKCRGTGSAMRDADRCKTCGGAGHRIVEERHVQEIPRGCAHETKFTHANKGNHSLKTAGLVGDLVVVALQADDKRFNRQGNDLYFSLKIDYVEALFGFRREFRHLDGTSRFVIVHDETKAPIADKSVWCAWGKGMPYGPDKMGRSGDLYLIFDVIMPSKPVSELMSAEQRDSLKKLLMRPTKLEKGSDFTTKTVYHPKAPAADAKAANGASNGHGATNELETVELASTGPLQSARHKFVWQELANNFAKSLNAGRNGEESMAADSDDSSEAEYEVIGGAGDRESESRGGGGLPFGFTQMGGGAQTAECSHG